ncbi:MAG: dTMP kinase [Actinobacteria bacterium]|nr:dTMP kinase [Actinomycetota bacterium]
MIEGLNAPGLFLVIEGGEGAGKSTQSAALADYLVARDHRVVRTREPGGTPAAEAIRSILLDPAYTGLDDRAEALLFAAARGDHAARVIRPALGRGDIVISDRFMDSSIAYQGVGRDLGLERVAEISLWATSGLRADLTILLDVDPQIGLARVVGPDRLESEPLEWHRRVRQGFLDIAAADPGRYLVLDASRPAEDLAVEIAVVVEGLVQDP